MRRKTRLAMLGAMVAALIAPGIWVSTPSAQAVSYRYWSYWTGGDSGWSYSSFGPASLRPADGSVEGWRFGIGSGTTGAGLTPRTAPDFQRVCATTEATPDTKRVAIVIDPGLPEHAPAGESPRSAWAMCVTAPPSATGFDILRAAASVRTRQGMVCGLAGYPTSECAVIVNDPRTPPDTTATPPPRPTPKPTPASTPVGPPQSTPAASPRPTATREVAPADTGTDATPAAPGVDSPVRESRHQSGDESGDESADESGNASAQTASPPSHQRAAYTAATAPDEQVHRAQTPDPQITIVSAAVTDTSTGPGPAAAAIGALVIVILGVGAYLRRRLRT